MKKIIFFILSLSPSFIHVGVRRIMGQKIGKNVKLKIGTLIFSNKVAIGSNSKIGPFTFIKCRELEIGENTIIKSLVIIKTLRVKMLSYVHIAPLCVINSEFIENSSLLIGNHSRIFPFCWLDTGEGITIGEHVGIGGHTLMFTHGVWSNFIDGGPVNFGPINIENNVWLPWRVFILPNVTIGENAIIGANSLINKDVETNTLAAGSPARTLKRLEFDKTKRKERLIKVLRGYSKYIEFKMNIKSDFKNDRLNFEKMKIVIDETSEIHKDDLLILLDKKLDSIEPLISNGISVLDYSKLTIYLNTEKNPIIMLLISYLRRYGVRLYLKKIWD